MQKLDSFKHKGMRRQLIDELRKKGISDEQVLSAIDAVPRHFFLDTVFEQYAYSDRAFQIGAGQTISQPYTVAFQTQLLNVQKRDKILEVGTGSGFQTCILCKMGATVFSIERQRELLLKARFIVQKFNFNPNIIYGDGYQGLPTWAPYDKILITCGAPSIPTKLVEQLKIGGLMVVPVGEGKKQIMLRITKTSEKSIQSEEFGTFSFVPMLSNRT